MRTDGIGNRHLLAADGLAAAPSVGEQYVRIVVSERWMSSEAGQLLTSCLVNLLCRQVKLVRRIEIVAPESPVLIKLPSGGHAKSFQACLEELAIWAVSNAVPVSTLQSDEIADIIVHIGDAPSDPTPGQNIHVVGEGWRAWVGDLSHLVPSFTPISPNPLGPFLAAGLAAGEIFKRSRGILRGRYLASDGYSLWSGRSSSAWTDLSEGPEIANAVLSPIHVIGAGAVGNALGYIIANLGLGGGYLVLVDDDYYDETNLNRCLLAGWTDLDDHKVYAIERALKTSGIGVYPYPKTLKSYAVDTRKGLRADVARQVEDLTFETVLSCVDKGMSRHDVQGLRPGLLLGGSTFNLQSKSNRYSGRPGAACLACFNPAENDGERMRALEKRIRKMSTEERANFLSTNGLEIEAVEEYLVGTQCGGLGEAALRDFATRPPAEFSVGFVSLGAGLLLASALLRNTVFSDVAPHRGDMSTLNFLNGGLMDSWLAADNECELECQSRFAVLSK